jgi:hypothetical protein
MRNVPKGSLCKVKNWLAFLSISSGIYYPKSLAFFIVFSISYLSWSTRIDNLAISRLGTIATRVSSKVKGKNFCFQLYALPKQFPSDKKITSY